MLYTHKPRAIIDFLRLGQCCEKYAISRIHIRPDTPIFLVIFFLKAEKNIFCKKPIYGIRRISRIRIRAYPYFSQH